MNAITATTPLSVVSGAPAGVAVQRPAQPAHIIKDDAEAITVATGLAARFAEGASERDRNRIWPLAERDAYSQSGLWSIELNGTAPPLHAWI